MDEPVTCWLRQLEAGNEEAARLLWQRYYRELVELARARLGTTPRRVADEGRVVMLSSAVRCWVLRRPFECLTTRASVLPRTVGAVVASERSRRRASASMIAVEEYLAECRGRKRLVPSSRWKRRGLVASSGGVSDTD